jgi:hypothetical protein
LNKLLLFSTILLSSNAFADYSDIVNTDNSIELGATSLKMNYQEMNDGRLGSVAGIADSETGTLDGTLLRMKSIFADRYYLSTEYTFYAGTVTYTGSYYGESYGSLVIPDLNESVQDWNFSGGVIIYKNDENMLTPFFQYILHDWERSINGGESYRASYVMGGVMWQYSPIKKLVISTSYSIGKTRDATLTDNDLPYDDSGNYPLGREKITCVTLNINYALIDNIHLFAEISSIRSAYGSSNTVVTGSTASWEPASTTDYTKFNAGIGLNF